MILTNHSSRMAFKSCASQLCRSIHNRSVLQIPFLCVHIGTRQLSQISSRKYCSMNNFTHRSICGNTSLVCQNLTNIKLNKHPIDGQTSGVQAYRSLQTSTEVYNRRIPLDKKKSNTDNAWTKELLTDEAMSLKLSADNTYLSYTRNSYMMTLAAATLMNFDAWDNGDIAGGVAILVSTLNLLVGSLEYMSILSSLMKLGHISATTCRLKQLMVILHAVMWLSVLILIFPVDNLTKEEEDMIKGKGIDD